jgi:arabinogalactan oligomer/maltooligosaccharide transport system permease protein
MAKKQTVTDPVVEEKKTVKKASQEPVVDVKEAKKEKRHMGMRAKKNIGNTIIYTILVIMSVIWLAPFIFIVLQSFRTESTGISGYIVPKQWGFDNYVNLFTSTKFPRWFLNTFLVSLATAVIQTIMVLTMAYTLSRIRFKGRKFLMNFMLILGMFPGFLTMIVLYQVLKLIGLTQSGAVPGLILVYVASSGMGYYVSKGFFDTVPKSLDEVARVDGATRLQVMTRVILPLSKPIVIYTVLTAFMGPWGDFMFARLIAFGDDSVYNVAVGLNQFLTADQASYSYTLFCAGGIIVAIPIAILFMVLQRYYVEGVTGGAVKG